VSTAAGLRRIARAGIANASAGRERFGVGPFFALVDRVSSSPWASLAVPDPDARPDADWAGALPTLAARFAERGRQVRFEFFEDLFPDLGPVLEAAGWPLTSRDPLLVCGPAELVPPVAVPGLSFEPVDSDAPDALIETFLDVQHAAFEPGAPREPSADDRSQLRTRMRLGAIRCLLARRDGIPAGAGSALPSSLSAEIAGIGTPPEFRARGIGSAVTARLTSGLFADGIGLAWLTAGGEAAERVYRRLGFRPLGAFQRNHGR
jgi:ribosomal protein S18 acetylase RimI-like enzyme